ncbi:MAG TPA: LOG family protein [Patescibacteria group bacterium]|nr:LOG family protein [Patescibacteria group bacterium]
MGEDTKYAGHKIIKNIAFFGDADISEADETYKAAFDTAELLAKEGYVIVDGGGPGVMEAATSGAEKVNGKTVSVTFDPTNAPGFEGKYIGNVTDEEIVTTNYIERMFKLMENSDVFLIFKGGSGTISEFGTAWVLAKLYYGHHKPFILFGDFWIEIIDVLKKNMYIDAKEMAVFEICRTKEEVLATIKKFETKISSRNKDEYGKDDEYDKAFTK